MKKMMFMVALAMGLSAQAATDFTMTYKMKTTYQGSTTASYYKMFARGTSDPFLGSTITDIKNVEDYFAAAVKGLESDPQAYNDAVAAWSYTGGEEPKGHGFTTTTSGSTIKFTRSNGVEKNNCWAVIFYDDGETQAYRVVQANGTETSKIATTTTEGSNGDWGVWHTVSIPEPTSGLLMLLGMAGLALKRKRA